MRTLKRGLCLLLALVMAASLFILPAGASGSSPLSTDHAHKLAALHLFKGGTAGYQLDDVPTRIQGLVMLIRLLGLEEEALACTQITPFTDLTWGKSYVAYAYHNGLTTGTSTTTFSPNTPLDARSYVTFLLRALGCQQFSWKSCLETAADMGMITRQSAGTLLNAALNRGDMVDLSYAALTQELGDGSGTLAEKLCREGVFTQAEGTAAGVLGGSRWTLDYVPYDNSTITHAKKTVSTSTGKVTANVLTVNTQNSNVHVKSAMVNNTIGATKPFSQIAKESGAAAVINGNFFNAYGDFKRPIGHVMVGGEFLYGNSGLTSLGITADGQLRIGRPALFTRFNAAGGYPSWSIYEVNTSVQLSGGSTLYTPAFGSSVTITLDGSLLTLVNNVVTAYQPVAANTVVSIPQNGCVIFMGPGYTATDYFTVPTVGTALTREYFLQTADPEGFTLDGVVSVVSGAPRLVQDGAICTQLEAGFQEERFTTLSTPRTAIGVNQQGKLLLVSTPAATIQQMRELMLALGCVDAFNLDGGASCAMYYNGSMLATPGRELTVTLQVFVDQ